MHLLRSSSAAAPLPLLFDPLAPCAGAWMALPLTLLRRLPALRRSGPLAFLGLVEQLAAADPVARMSLHLVYVPADSLGRLAEGSATLPLRARAHPAPGCSERLQHLPPLDAGVVRFGFPGTNLLLADGRQGWVTGQSEGKEEALQVMVEGTKLEIPLRHFMLRVRNWSRPLPGQEVALQGHAKNS